MKINEPVSNPILLGAMKVMNDEDSHLHKDQFVRQLCKAKLVAPVTVAPGSENYLEDNMANIRFLMIRGKDGKDYFVAYTDVETMNKAENVPEKFKKVYATLNIAEFAQMMIQLDDEGNQPDFAGVIINPFTENIVVRRDLVITMFNKMITDIEAIKAQGGNLTDNIVRLYDDSDANL